MNATIQAAVDALVEKGWRCTMDERLSLPPLIVSRYPWIPADVAEAIGKLRELVHPTETFWILAVSDYKGESESAFAWNEWEIITTEGPHFSESDILKTKSFWDHHFPLALSVGNGYEYFALTRDGTVVTGAGPDFEETEAFADSYPAFLWKVAKRI